MNQKIEETAPDPVDRLLQDKQPPSSGKSIAVLALLVALASVAATTWQWWQSRESGLAEANQRESLVNLGASQQQLSSAVAAIETRLAALDTPADVAEVTRRQEQLKTLEDSVAGLLGQTGEEASTVNAMQGSIRSLEQRLSATESGLVSVAASSQNSSVELDIAEIDFLLRTASERLQLFSDPTAADLALQAADLQLEALNDPMFLSVRQRIATARQELAAVPRLDPVALTARLGDLQTRVKDLPFRGEAAPAPAPAPAEATGWWQSFKNTLASLVTVRRRVPEDQSMLSLDDKDYLRQGLWLQLESARLALVRNDSSVYSGSLERVHVTVSQFFEKGSPRVQAVLDEVSDLQKVSIAPAMPDISAPWVQLRQLRDSRRLLQSATPVERADPAAVPAEKVEPAPAPVDSVESVE